MSRIVVLVVAFCISCSTGFAEIYVVNPDGSGDFPTIKAAIDFVSDGDIIELTDGTFAGDGNRDITWWRKSITIRSQSGDPHCCLIDCERQAPGFVIDLSGSLGNLEGITVTRGQADPFGGGIQIDQGSLYVRNCIFSDNHSYPGNGGAVFIDECASVTFNECSFVGNVGGPGGAICT